MGGYLAHPERHWALFRTPFWREYPFALPCFVAAFAASVTVIMGYFLLDEVCSTFINLIKLICLPDMSFKNEETVSQQTAKC